MIIILWESGKTKLVLKVFIEFLSALILSNNKDLSVKDKFLSLLKYNNKPSLNAR